MAILSAFFAGLVFGIGLILSGMTDPTKVIGFLDVTGQWNPALLFVMLGAIAVSMIAFQLVKPHKSLLGQEVSLPKQKHIDQKLVLGAALFGIGWGLAGFCPGPVLVSLSSFIKTAGSFTLAMIVGMLVVDHFNSNH